MNGNGSAFTRVLDLGDCTPRRVPVRIRRGGETVTLQAYHYETCPVWVDSQLSRADMMYREHSPDRTKIQEWSIDEHLRFREVYGAYLRDSLLALVEGLEQEEAEVLARDQSIECVAQTTLVALGWFVRREAQDESPPTQT